MLSITAAVLSFASAHAAAEDHKHAHNQQENGRERMDLRVMTFNIRYGTANDGDNAWKHRDSFVVDVIKQFNPDLLATQEVLGFQAEHLRKNLPDHRHHGVSREDGQEDGEGERCSIFFCADRFVLIDKGHFWLSETPEKIGSKSWDSSLPRMASWVKLKDRNTQQLLVFINTHFDHRGPTARLESMKLIRKFVDDLPIDTAAIVAGDFNTTEDRAPYIVMTGETNDKASKLTDSYRQVHPQRQDDENTFSGFKSNTHGSRIDWILHTAPYLAESAAIDRTSRNGRNPSDHYPVNVVLKTRPRD